jgi:branched-chain amino acid transport system permease protein
MSRFHLLAGLGGAVLLGAFAMTAPPFWITLANNIGLSTLVVLGLVLLTGVGGMTSFGQAAFVGIGAYTTAWLTTVPGFSPLVTLPAVIAVTGLCAVVIGLVTVRLPGHYLPLATIATGISLYYLFGKLDALGRYDGISGIPPLVIAGWSFADPRMMFAVVWVFVALAYLATAGLLDSRVGRAIRALRGGRTAAESFGIDQPRIKLIVFVYAGLLAGVSGWLYALLQRSVNPTPFGLGAGIQYLFMAVLGGPGQIWGALVGATGVELLEDVLRRVTPSLVGKDLQLEALAFGVLVILVLHRAPDGIWPWVATLWFRYRKPVQCRPTASEPLAPRPRRIEAPRTGPILEVEEATKRFGGLTAVNKVSFTVGAGEIVALIGPNGAGKSTTFNLITGALELSAGRIVFDGRPVDDLSPRRAAALGMARTFQHVKVVPDMSVVDNVAIGAHGRGTAGTVSCMVHLERAEEARILAEAARQAERVGLADELFKPAGSLALGLQRLVEVARALAADPKLILLDEPAAGLRHFEKKALAELLVKLRDEGMSVLLVEHDMGFVMGLADRIVVLNFGTHIAEGTPAEIRTHPAVVEAYLGGEG